MTYRQFLLFVFGPVLVVVVSALVVRAVNRRHGQYPLGTAIASVGAVLPVALLFTTPWDSWLIANSVWWYPPGSVLGTLFGVPVEEYLFMVGLTALTGCWTILVTMSARPALNGSPTGRRYRLVSGVSWLVAALVAAGLAMTLPHATYLGSLLAWFGIPLAVQSFVGADVLRAATRARLGALALTPVLWVEDAIAIHAGAWQVSDVRTVGVTVGGLPIEEMIFFLMVNLLVVNTVILVTDAKTHSLSRKAV